MSDGLLLEAERRWRQGDLAGAQALLDGALAEAPTYDRLIASGVVEYQAGEAHRGRTRLLQAMQSAPGRPDAYRHLGDLFAAEGHADRAAGFYQLAAAADPRSPEALNALVTLYEGQGLIYSAKQAARQSLALDPEQTELRAWLTEADLALPDRDVTVYVPCYNAAPYLARVLEAVFAQSYPLAEVLVIDDGSTDDSLEIATRFPVRVVTHGTNKGLSAARNTAILAAHTDYLANLDADVLPDPHWLEHLMLYFEADRLNAEAGEPAAQPLGGMMGRLDELHDVALPDQWRAVHMGQHHGDETKDEIPHIYGCNGVYLRRALIQVGGYDVRYRTNGEDCDLSERVRAQGFRLAYQPAARCKHLRRDTLASVLRTIWRYHTPYYEYRFGLFSTGRCDDVLQKLPENLSRFRENWQHEAERRAFHLRYLSFLGLPWRMLSDLKLAAEQAPDELAPVVRETQAAVFLGLFSLLAELGTPRDLHKMIHEDLTPCLPDDPQLAELCAWDKVEAVVTAGRGQRGTNPISALVHRDTAAMTRLLESLAEVWSQFEAIDWSMIRASAFRLRHEADTRRELKPGGPRIALVNAPWAVDGRIGVRAGSRWPFTQESHGQRVPCYVPFPFFLATAAAMLKDDGFEVTLVDAIAEGLFADEFLRRLEGFAPDVVLMETATASHEIDLDWALQFKERLGDGVQVVVCGPHATALGAPLLREAPQVDAIVLGEYEPSFLDLMRALRDGSPLTEIPGLIWRELDGTVHEQTERRALPPMSAFPWPERETLPMYNYFDSFANAMPWPNVQMHASRGCPFQCIFCVWPQVVYDGQKYRTRDNADIVKEMTWLVDHYGFRAVYFDDDTFNIDTARIVDLCDRIAAAELGVPICAMGRADTTKREAYEAMKRAGVVGLKFGVETGDADMMVKIRKRLDLEKVRQTVQWCKELGIGVHLTFSFGGPGETRESAEKTIRLALELDPDTVQFSLMTPFPGTAMFETALRDGTLLTTDWKQYDGARYTVVRGEHLTREELEDVLREAHRRWLLHLAEREILKQDGGVIGPRTQLPFEQVTAEADRSLGGLGLVTPLELLAHTSALTSCLDKVEPGGLLVVARSGQDHLPQEWSDYDIEAWADRAGVEVLCRFSGFNDELCWGFRAPRSARRANGVPAR